MFTKNDWIMQEQLISLSTAKLAKEKKFEAIISPHYFGNELINDGIIRNWNSNQYRKNCYSAPSQSLLQRWFREVHYMSIEPSIDQDGWNCLVRSMKDGSCLAEMPVYYYDTYEQALEVGLLEALKLIEI